MVQEFNTNDGDFVLHYGVLRTSKYVDDNGGIREPTMYLSRQCGSPWTLRSYSVKSCVIHRADHAVSRASERTGPGFANDLGLVATLRSTTCDMITCSTFRTNSYQACKLNRRHITYLRRNSPYGSQSTMHLIQSQGKIRMNEQAS